MDLVQKKRPVIAADSPPPDPPKQAASAPSVPSEDPDKRLDRLLKLAEIRAYEKMAGGDKSSTPVTPSPGTGMSPLKKSMDNMKETFTTMKELQDFLKSPKLRGNIGEQILKELLGQMLPKQSFHLQYTFKSGAIVDAAIKTGNGIIPIDSKFPMEGFRKMITVKNDAERKLIGREFEKE